MTITVTNGTVTYQQNQFFNVRKNTVFYSSKSISGCYGKWYFEGTHKEGGNNRHLFGFGYTNSQGVHFCLPGTNTPLIFISRTFYSDKTVDGYGRTTFSVENEHTVGIGIDYDNEMFFVFHGNNYFEYRFYKPDNCKRIHAVAFGATHDLVDDNISVNFGMTPFKYNITSFTPWQENIEKISCFVLHDKSFKITPLIFVLFVNSY